MIISASRRTDIPAWHAEWLLNRLRAGEVLVRNPFRPTRISRVALSPKNVDCLVFWTKNPGPMLPLLEEIDAMGYPYYFQFTLTPYGTDLETGLPPKEELVRMFRRLSKRLGSKRVIWRYDPVVVCEAYPLSYHIESFGRLARALEGAAQRCVFSFFDAYPGLGKLGRTWERGLTPDGMDRLAAAFAAAAQERGMELVTCAEQGDYSRYGVRHGACIDREWIEGILGVPLEYEKGKNTGQRSCCGCMESVDIGVYGTCRNGCRYCYAGGGKHFGVFDTGAPLLDGWPGMGDTVYDRPVRSLRKEEMQQLLFD